VEGRVLPIADTRRECANVSYRMQSRRGANSVVFTNARETQLHFRDDASRIGVTRNGVIGANAGGIQTPGGEPLDTIKLEEHVTFHSALGSSSGETTTAPGDCPRYGRTVIAFQEAEPVSRTWRDHVSMIERTMALSPVARETRRWYSRPRVVATYGSELSRNSSSCFSPGSISSIANLRSTGRNKIIRRSMVIPPGLVGISTVAPKSAASACSAARSLRCVGVTVPGR
jgi:hypothetical protein